MSPKKQNDTPKPKLDSPTEVEGNDIEEPRREMLIKHRIAKARDTADEQSYEDQKKLSSGYFAQKRQVEPELMTEDDKVKYIVKNEANDQQAVDDIDELVPAETVTNIEEMSREAPKSPQPCRSYNVIDSNAMNGNTLAMPVIYLSQGNIDQSPATCLRDIENEDSIENPVVVETVEKDMKSEGNAEYQCKDIQRSNKLPPFRSFEHFVTPVDPNLWNQSQQHIKFDIPTMLKRLFDICIYPQLKIVINGEVFRCHSLVLRAYSTFFRQLPAARIVHLPVERVTQRAFVTIYTWALKNVVNVNFDLLLEVFCAAKFLGIQQLIDLCWAQCEDQKNSEVNAVYIYQKAKKFDIHLEDLMFGRVCKFFLQYVATKEFQELDIESVVNLLERNTIGVNTEMEVFMAGVVWLYYDWPRRQAYVKSILDCVRFTLMPFLFLLAFRKRQENPVIDYILNMDIIEERVNEGILEGHDMVNCREGTSTVGQREWIYDAQCEYHHSEACNQFLYLSYIQFLSYLEKLQKLDINHWQTLQSCDDARIRCCQSDSVRNK